LTLGFSREFLEIDFISRSRYLVLEGCQATFLYKNCSHYKDLLGNLTKLIVYVLKKYIRNRLRRRKIYCCTTACVLSVYGSVKPGVGLEVVFYEKSKLYDDDEFAHKSTFLIHRQQLAL